MKQSSNLSEIHHLYQILILFQRSMFVLFLEAQHGLRKYHALEVYGPPGPTSSWRLFKPASTITGVNTVTPGFLVTE